MEKTLRTVGGGEMEMKGKLKFSEGDIIHKVKHHNTIVYYIVDVAERDGEWHYRYFSYSGSLFENHRQAGWRDADYFDSLVMNDNLGSKTDVTIGYYNKKGNVRERNPSLSIGGRKFYTISLDKMGKLLDEGPRVIKDAWLFYETAGEGRGVAIHGVGWNSEALADDMLRMSYTHESGTWVDHEKKVMEAVERGLWIPIRVTDSRIDGTKETEL